MGLFSLSRVCSAVFLVAAINSAFAANPPVAPSNPVGFTTVTTPYSSTTSTPQTSHIPPRGVPNVGGGTSYTAPPTRAITPIVSGGGFKAPTAGGITITGVKSPPIPVSGTANYPPSVVKNGAKALLRGNLAGLVLGAGLQQLLNGVGALISSGGEVVRTGPPIVPPLVDCAGCEVRASRRHGNSSFANCARPLVNNEVCVSSDSGGGNYCGLSWASPKNLVGFKPIASYSVNCYYSSTLPPLPPTTSPIPPDDLDDAVDSSFNPDPTDFDNLSPHMFPQSYTQNPIPSVILPSVTTIDTDSNGNTTTTNTTTTINFTVDNSKPIPDVDTTVTDDKNSFTNGVPSGSSSTSTTTKPNTNPTAPPDPAAGGATIQFPEIPTDCEFMPTVCAFIEWYKDDDLGEDPDLSSIIKDDEEFEKTKVISFGAAVCPAPYTIQISSLAMSVDLSFDFFCQFAEYAKALVLAAAYIFAAYISLGVARG